MNIAKDFIMRKFSYTDFQPLPSTSKREPNYGCRLKEKTEKGQSDMESEPDTLIQQGDTLFEGK